MPGKVTLLVTAGPIEGARFEFAEHDTFLFGRSPECHARLAASDTSASRHHFLLEVNPPAARLRDLGSLNGTHVNGVRHGGRARHESPEDARKRAQTEVDLRDGDRVRVGATIFTVGIDTPAVCCECGKPIEDTQRKAAAWVAGTFLCPDCRRHAGATGRTGVRVRAPGPGGSSQAPTARPAPTDADAPPRKARRVGDYEIGPLLGKGGMGVVHRARRRSDDRVVALKLLLPKVAVGPEVRAGLLREIDVTRRLHHPQIVEMLDFGEDGEGFFFAMEYCPGGTLAARIRLEGALALDVAGPLALQALDGLAYAHAAGFVHRDIKPDNVLIGSDGSAKLTDFGLAKSFEQAGLSGMTATGAVAGTFPFMPREQLTRFRQLRPESDVWSMGATVYFMLTREYTREFKVGKDPIAVILKGGIVPLRERVPDLPASVAAVVDRAIADDPEARYPTGGEFCDALRKALD
jgi:eukaryotic-like serine/threonine-protein kinase